MCSLPRARREDLLVRELDDELLVHDRQRNRAHCLNPVAAWVWRRCDGRTSIEELAERMRDELGTSDPLPIVQLVLSQLSDRHLLTVVVPALSPLERL